MGTRMEAMSRRLRELREAKDFEQCFAYAVYLAHCLIECDRSGRRLDEAMERQAGKDGQTAILKDYMAHLTDVDGFTDQEQAFFLEFIDPEWDGDAP